MMYLLQPLRVSVIGCHIGPVDMVESLAAKFSNFRVVFFVVDITMCLVKGFNRLQQAAASFLDVNCGVVVGAHAVVNRCLLDLAYCRIDL